MIAPSKKVQKGFFSRKLKLFKRKASLKQSFISGSAHEILKSKEFMCEGQNSRSSKAFENSCGCEDFVKPSSSKRQKLIVHYVLVTSSKAQKVCKTWSEGGVSIPTLTQSGVYKAVRAKE